MISKTHTLKILNDNILRFWSDRMVDTRRGGFFGRIDGHGTLHPEADRSVILNSRILWTYSAAFRMTGNQEYKDLADSAYTYITTHFLDSEYGGVFWMVSANGETVNAKKQVYAQAFALYAFAQYAAITSSTEPKERAIEIFLLLEKHAFDAERNGYYEAFDRQWRVLEDVRLSEKDMNATKTMNTHLHVLEAYTQLSRVWQDKTIHAQLVNLIELMSTRFLDAGNHFRLFFDNDWKLLSDSYSYGHDIEGSWLLCEAAEATGEAALLRRIEQLAVKMTDAALEGLDQDGGLMNEGHESRVTDTDKHWWPQAEALVGLANAYYITGQERYLELVQKVWKFIEKYLLDEAGEWYWKVDKSGQIDFMEDRAGPWKCPYHNGRAMMELHKRLKT